MPFSLNQGPVKKYKKQKGEAKNERGNDHLIGKPNMVIEESDNDFEIYEDGNYCEDYCRAYIIEKEIKKYNKN